ncbi:MAG: hypothetical protein LBT36_05230 [Oscillospiraceae bacterium]|jgi:hypothetical protein|nr:hypothetical protein [Oscillospiraceae bacterium]
MNDALRGWIFGMVGAAVITAVTMTVTPEGRVKRIVAVTCGFVMLLALIRPLEGFDYERFKLNFSRLREQAEAFSDPLGETDKNLVRIIIEEKYAAYILDKAKLAGVEDLSVAVEARRGEDGYWYPERAYLTTQADSAQRARLAYEIEAGLGIAPKELIWGERDEG